MLPASIQFEAALRVIKTLRACGHQAFLAGGCVRDLLLNRDPKDYDVATSATPDIVLALFPRTFAVGAHFGVVLVADTNETGAPAGAQLAPPQVVTEVATFRSDGAYSDGRHPDAVRYTTSAEEDVRRRDFTINGLLLDPLQKTDLSSNPRTAAKLGAPGLEFETWDTTTPSPTQSEPALKGTDFSPYINATKDEGALALEESSKPEPAFPERQEVSGHDFSRAENEPNSAGALAPEANLRSAVIDHVNGLADLNSGIIRAIGRPELRFEEDHLRMLRGVRFAARFNFALDPATQTAIQALAHKTAAVSRERVRDELTKMLTEGHARRAFQLLDATGLLKEVLPEIAKMKGVEQPPQYHPEGDVFLHTLLLLDQLEPGCSPTLAWGALLHDVGKPPTFRRAPDRIRFDGHVEVGVAMGAEILRRFHFSNNDTQQILALIQNHMRFADAPRMRTSTLKRFFRLDNFPEHLALHRMDCMAASGNLDHYNFVRERYESMPADSVRPTPLLTGRELIAAGYQPGAAFKQILQAVEDAQLEGTIATLEAAMNFVREKFGAPPDPA